MSPLIRPSPKTISQNQKLRLYLAHNRSYDSLKNFYIFPIAAIVFFRIFRINKSRIKLLFYNNKKHFLAQNRVIWRIKCKNRSNGLAYRRVEKPKPKKCSKFRTGGVYISPIWGAKTPGWIEPQFFLVVGVHDVGLITPFKFGDDRFSGFGLAESQILHFPIDFEGRPYNTHTIVWGVI